MPKVPALRSLSETRSIVVANSLAKWYLTSLTIRLEAEVSGDLQRLGLYGFSPGRYQKAFDNIAIQVVARAPEALNVHRRLTHGILEPLVGASGILCFEGLEATTSWDRSIRAGGTESPLLFNLVVLAMCADLFKSWGDLQLGYPATDI
eukprot:7378693-Pyramimonas_sp.AAC.1